MSESWVHVSHSDASGIHPLPSSSGLFPIPPPFPHSGAHPPFSGYPPPYHPHPYHSPHQRNYSYGQRGSRGSRYHRGGSRKRGRYSRETYGTGREESTFCNSILDDPWKHLLTEEENFAHTERIAQRILSSKSSVSDSIQTSNMTEALSSEAQVPEVPAPEKLLPLSEIPSEEPLSEIPSEEPLSEIHVPSEEPLSEIHVPSEEPLSEIPSEEPLSEIPSEEPLSEIHVPSEEPLSEKPSTCI